MGTEQPEAPPRSPVSRATLFAAFLKIGLLGFGGVMPWARRVLVEERAWLSDREFAELIGICQVLPGPNVVNLSVILGSRWQGPIGSLLALTGILFVPVIAVLILATFYASVAHAPIARSAIAGASAAAAGLIIGTAIRLITGSRPPLRAIVLAALAPGPNAMVVSRLGWKVAGIAGAFVATIAACGPSSLVSYFAIRALERLRDGAIRGILQRALAPVAIGLVLASGYTLARAADRSAGAVLLTMCGAAAVAATR